MPYQATQTIQWLQRTAPCSVHAYNYLKYSGNQRMIFIISSLSQLLYIVSTSLQHFNASFRNSYSKCISLCLDNFRNVKSEIRCRPRENAPFAPPPRPCRAAICVVVVVNELLRLLLFRHTRLRNRVSRNLRNAGQGLWSLFASHHQLHGLRPRHR